MNTTMRWFALALVVGFVWQSGVAGTVLGTEGRKCYPSTSSLTSPTTISVFGDGIEKIDRVMSGSGVSVSIVAKRNGAQNNRGPFAGKGVVDLRIATNNATPGDKLIGLIVDPDLSDLGGKFSFTITVVASPTVTEVSVPTPADAFQEITVTLNGIGLQEAKIPAHSSLVIDNENPFVTLGGNASVSSVRVLSSSATSLQAKIVFSAPIQDATLDLSFRSDNECVPLGVSQPFLKRVHVKRSTVRNYVESITFPNGSTFDKHSNGTIHINLLFPITSFANNPSDNSPIIWFKLLPSNAFARPDGTPFRINPEGFSSVKPVTGVDTEPITFQVVDWPGGQPGQTITAKIQTWMQSTNTNTPPNFMEKTFNVRFIQ